MPEPTPPANLRRQAAAALLALPCAIGPLPAQAQSALSPVLVTGSRVAVTPSGLAQSVTVIDQREIQLLHPARLEDILGRLAGVHVDSAGRTGGFTSLYLRGAENSHLLVMIDGVKVNDPTTTRGSAFDLSALDPAQIERIELLRGPASAIYGGEALAGVLHIITRRAADDGLHGAGYAALGGQRHRRLGGSLSLGNPTLQASLSVGAARDGRRSGDDAYLALDTLSAALRVAPFAGVEGELFARRGERDSDAFPDDSGGPRLALNRDKTRRDSTDSQYGVRFGAGDERTLRVHASASVYERDEQADNAFVDPGVRFPVPAFTSDTDFRRRSLLLTGTRAFGEAATLVVGAEHQRDKGTLASLGDFDFDGNPDPLSFSLRRRTESVFAEARLRPWRPLALQIGLRHDKVQRLDAETTPHLGAVWELPNGATTLKASYNEGFKPPSFFALGFPIGANPDLRPERSRNVELAGEHRFGAGGASSLQLGVFQIRYRDLVDFDGTTFTNINRGTIVVKGIEPTLKLSLGASTQALLNATLLDIDERDGLQPLRNRPERKAGLSVVHALGDSASLFAALAHTGGFLDRSNPTGDIRLSGYTVVDAGYSRRFGPLMLKLALDNVLDEDYEPFVGFPGQERRLRIELRAAF